MEVEERHVPTGVSSAGEKVSKKSIIFPSGLQEPLPRLNHL